MSVLSDVIDMLNDDQCRRFVNGMHMDGNVRLRTYPCLARTVAAAGRIMHRLPDDLREVVIKTAEAVHYSNKVTTIASLSQNMVHLTPGQCERLFTLARHSGGRGFDDENIGALHALVNATWPWSARWEAPPVTLEEPQGSH